MTQINAAEHAVHLRALADRCATLKDDLSRFTPTTSADTHARLAGHLTQIQQLTVGALEPFPALLHSQIAHLAQSSAVFNFLRFIVEDTTAAAADLGRAIKIIHLDVGLFHSGNVYPLQVRLDRREWWIKDIASPLDDAAQRLTDAEEDCRNVAYYLDSTIPTPADAVGAAPAYPADRRGKTRLSNAQIAALRYINRNVATVFRGTGGKIRFDAGQSPPVAMATYTALLKKQLIARDTSTNLRAGQRVTLTPAGHAALHKHLARRHAPGHGRQPTDIRTSAP